MELELEWNWNGIGMELKWNRMEWNGMELELEWNWNGTGTGMYLDLLVHLGLVIYCGVT